MFCAIGQLSFHFNYHDVYTSRFCIRVDGIRPNFLVKITVKVGLTRSCAFQYTLGRIDSAAHLSLGKLTPLTLDPVKSLTKTGKNHTIQYMFHDECPKT